MTGCSDRSYAKCVGISIRYAPKCSYCEECTNETIAFIHIVFMNVKKATLKIPKDSTIIANLFHTGEI